MFATGCSSPRTLESTCQEFVVNYCSKVTSCIETGQISVGASEDSQKREQCIAEGAASCSTMTCGSIGFSESGGDACVEASEKWVCSDLENGFPRGQCDETLCN